MHEALLRALSCVGYASIRAKTSTETDMTKDDHPLIKQIRARSTQPEVRHDNDTQAQPSKSCKKKLHFPHVDGEKVIERYKRSERWLGGIEQRTRRYVALALLEERIQQGKLVQNRSLQNNLTAAENLALQAEQQRQKLMRAGKQKPQAIKQYEAELNRVTLQAVKVQELESAGHDEGAAAVSNLCKTQIADLLVQLRSAVAQDPSLQDWLDRALPEQNEQAVEQLPRSITSTSKYCRAQRMSSAQVKLAAIQAAMQRLQEQ